MSNRASTHVKRSHQTTGDIAGELRASWQARLLAATSGAVGAVAGLTPHVLHHVLPLAGAAFLTGATGSVLFGALGLALTAPTLLRLRRRFGTWLAPGIALALFALAFTLSTFVIGPAFRGDDAPAKLEEPQADPHGH
jgi:hypothetical protein